MVDQFLRESLVKRFGAQYAQSEIANLEDHRERAIELFGRTWKPGDLKEESSCLSRLVTSLSRDPSTNNSIQYQVKRAIEKAVYESDLP